MKCGPLPAAKPKNACPELARDWIWLAIDTGSRLAVGVFIGSRDREGALGLWNSIPSVYKLHAVFYTDFQEAYNEAIPAQSRRKGKRKNQPH